MESAFDEWPNHLGCEAILVEEASSDISVLFMSVPLSIHADQGVHLLPSVSLASALLPGQRADLLHAIGIEDPFA
jgi:hypothetical protein